MSTIKRYTVTENTLSLPTQPVFDYLTVLRTPIGDFLYRTVPLLYYLAGHRAEGNERAILLSHRLPGEDTDRHALLHYRTPEYARRSYIFAGGPSNR